MSAIEQAYKRLDGVIAQLQLTREAHDVLKADLQRLYSLALDGQEKESEG